MKNARTNQWILGLVLSLACMCGASGAEEFDVIQQAKDLVRQGDQEAAITLLEQNKSQSSQPWLYAQEMGKLLFYGLREDVSVFAEGPNANVFSAQADQALDLFEEAISLAPEQTFDSRRLLASLLFDRGQYKRASQVLSEGLAYFSGQEDYGRQYIHLNKQMAVKRVTPWVCATAVVLTLMILLRIMTMHRPRRARDLPPEPTTQDTKIVLESTLQNTRWGALVLACGWLITVMLGPSSLAGMMYSATWFGRVMEGFFVITGLLFFCSAFLFFGKKVLVFQSNGHVALKEVGLMGRKTDWQVKAEDLSRVVTQKAYAYFYVYAVPRTIACTHVQLRDKAGRLYLVFRTPKKQDALALAKSLGKTLNLQLESEA